MMNKVAGTLAIIALLHGGGVLAGEPVGAGLAGLWRLESVERAGARAAGGQVRVFAAGEGLRYERRARAASYGPAGATESGTVRTLPGGGVLFEADAGAEGPGLSGRLQGRSGGATRAAPARGAYRLSGEVLSGLRREPGCESLERLTRWEAGRDGNDVRLFVDQDAFHAMEEAIRGAQHTIELQTFQWADDSTGRRFAELLSAKAREGVKVRCLVDSSTGTVNQMVSLHIKQPKIDVTGTVYRRGFRTSLFRRGLDDEMREAGVEFILAHGLLKGLLTSTANLGRRAWEAGKRLFGGGRSEPRESRGLMNHDHRKMLIVDGRQGFCGGMNIAVEYELDWHDVMALVEGPAAFQMHEMFQERWVAAGGKPGVALQPSPGPAGADVPVECVGSLPGLSTAIKELFLREIKDAKREIFVEVAYFLDDHVIGALGDAARRGVRTVVIIPSDKVNDVALVKEAFAWVHNEVVRSGVELYFFQPTLNHCKLAVFDGARTTVGSSNLDRMALELVAEANIFVPDVRFARAVMEQIFARDLPRSVRAQERPLKLGRKLVAGPLHLVRGLL